jgi:dephospho-CoA kinase
VLTGGRGAGKSTVIESLRYALGLEPLGEEAARLMKEIVRQVLRSGTKISLSALGEASQGKARLPQEHMGSIDSRPVRELVEEVLEGGKGAFEMRRLKYGF